MKKKLKLFVWESVLCDYSCGIMFALAPDVETARKLCIEKSQGSPTVLDWIQANPDIWEVPCAFIVWGGG